MKDTPFYKMKPGSKEVDSPTAFSGKDQSTMGAFNYGTPLNNDPGDKKTTSEPKIKTEQLDEIIMYGEDKSKKRYKPSEVGGRDAGTGKTYVAKAGHPVI